MNNAMKSHIHKCPACHKEIICVLTKSCACEEQRRNIGGVGASKRTNGKEMETATWNGGWRVNSAILVFKLKRRNGDE